MRHFLMNTFLLGNKSTLFGVFFSEQTFPLLILTIGVSWEISGTSLINTTFHSFCVISMFCLWVSRVVWLVFNTLIRLGVKLIRGDTHPARRLCLCGFSLNSDADFIRSELNRSALRGQSASGWTATLSQHTHSPPPGNKQLHCAQRPNQHFALAHSLTF